MPEYDWRSAVEFNSQSGGRKPEVFGYTPKIAKKVKKAKKVDKTQRFAQR